LGMKGAAEGAHMGHPDFRVNHRIFAKGRGREGSIEVVGTQAVHANASAAETARRPS